MQDECQPAVCRSACWSSQIILRQAFCAPSLTLWHETNAKRTVADRRARGGDGAADAAAMFRVIREPIPIHGRGSRPPTSTRQVQSDATKTGAWVRRNDLVKAGVERDLDGESGLRLTRERPPRPENHTVFVRISGSDTLGKELTALAPSDPRGRGQPRGPERRRSERPSHRQE